MQEEMMTVTATCAFFGGDRPIHPSTLYRGIAAGRYPKGIPVGPNTVRWSRSECLAARQQLSANRDSAKTPEEVYLPEFSRRFTSRV